MPDSHSSRPPLLTLLSLSAVAFAFAALVLPGVVKGTAPVPQASPSPTPQAIGGEGSWEDVERLIDEQKMEEARQIVASLRAAARAAGDDNEWAKALVTEVQLRTVHLLDDAAGELAAIRIVEVAALGEGGHRLTRGRDRRAPARRGRGSARSRGSA